MHVGLKKPTHSTGESTNQSSSYTWNEVNPISVSDNALNCRAYTQRYEYDKNGRILRMKHVANANNYTRKYNYAAFTNRLDSIDNGQSVPTVLSSFGYDNNGNQTTANTERHYEYDAGDMMRAYYNQTGAGVEPTVYAHYVYSGGARTKKLVRTASNEYESVVYLGPFEYHKKVTASTTEEKNYTQVIGGIEIRTGSFTGDITDTVTYSLGDHLGSVSTRVNSGRTIIDTEEYYPYGDSSMRTTDKKRYRYTGKEKDAESKLYYYGARYYTAWACTFNSVDPAAGSTHYQSSYNYADCNPIVMNDPTGMQSEGPGGGGGDQRVTDEAATVENIPPPADENDVHRYVWDVIDAQYPEANSYSVEINQVDGGYHITGEVTRSDGTTEPINATMPDWFSGGSSNSMDRTPFMGEGGGGSPAPKSPSSPAPSTPEAAPPAAEASPWPTTTTVNPQVKEANLSVVPASIFAAALAKELVTAAVGALTVPVAGEIVAGVLIAAAVVATVWALYELYTAPPIAVPHPIAIPIPVPPHGNNKNNPNKHIVYQIMYFDPQKIRFDILKYGIADSKYNTYDGLGNSRPLGQVRRHLSNKYPNFIVWYVVLYRLPNRAQALYMEETLVGVYEFFNNGRKPIEQIRP